MAEEPLLTRRLEFTICHSRKSFSPGHVTLSPQLHQVGLAAPLIKLGLRTVFRIKRPSVLTAVLPHPDSVIYMVKKHHFANKGPSSQSYDCSSSHVQIRELDHKEG